MAQGWSNVKEVPKSSPVLPNPLQSSKILLFPLQSPPRADEEALLFIAQCRQAVLPRLVSVSFSEMASVSRACNARFTSVERALHERGARVARP